LKSTLTLQQMNKGLYLLKVNTDKGSNIYKVIVK